MSSFSEKKIDETGNRYGRLVVIDETRRRGRLHWICMCDCGEPTVVLGGNLRTGNTSSCGCLEIEARYTHGMSRDPRFDREYHTWEEMKRRCSDRKFVQYDDYGGRGISVCDEWRNDFAQFFADMGPRPSAKHSLERIDNDKGYSKENCKWADKFEQNNNKRRRGTGAKAKKSGRFRVISD